MSRRAITRDLGDAHPAALLGRALNAEIRVTTMARCDDLGHLGDELGRVPEMLF